MKIISINYKKILLKYSLYLFFHIIMIKCEDECPLDKPIYDNETNSCTLKYCTKEQFENEECIISNKIIKEQWISRILHISNTTKMIYPTIALGTNNDLFFETNIGRTRKIFYSMEKNGRGFMDESQFNYIEFNNNNNIFTTYGNSALVTINNNKCFFKLSFYESIEMYDLVEKKYTINKLESFFRYKIQSYYNSLLRTKEENVFIYAYITTGNYLAMQKFKIITNDASNCTQIIKTLIEEEKTIPKNSRKCLITDTQYIECLDMDEEQTYYVRLYDKDLNFKKKFKLDNNNSPPKRAYSIYHEASYLKNSMSIFIYFTNISNGNSKPKVILKKLDNTLNLVDISLEMKSGILFEDMPYIFSDTEHSFTIINEHYFALASITTFNNRHLIISLFNIFNTEKTTRVHYFDIALKDLYNINYYSNIQSFYYNNILGIHFIHLDSNSNYISSMLLFSYANSSDPETINNIFENFNNTIDNLYKINLSEYISLDNNIFCYVLTGIKILSIPDSSTGIKILYSNSTQIKEGEIIKLDEEISISYLGEIEDIKKGNYFIKFAPTFDEPEYKRFVECGYRIYYIGKIEEVEWNTDHFNGRISKFQFSIGNCYKNCETCVDESNNPDDQKCETCTENYYFEENSKNCYRNPNEGYVFNKKNNIFSKCHENCKNCYDLNNDENKHNCLSCKENYLLYNNSNCLNCKNLNLYTNYEQTSCIDTIPLGYYLNNTEYNTIDKCHKNCLACDKGLTDDNNMNCLNCDNENGYYLIENTKNCERIPYEGYYLDEDKKLKRCYYLCKTCSSGPIYDENGEIKNMNCDSCKNELGYFINDEPSNKNCEFKEKEGEYYNSKDNKYYPCYNNCLTCFDKENNDFVMNCLTCDEENGYIFLTKNGNNCLNCKAQDQYINFDENKCIDEIPKGYYLKNNTINQIDTCYKKCETCNEKGISDDNMKCTSCSEDYIFLNNNCVEEMNCPNFFYFKINIDNNTLNIKEKNCLNKKNNCPNLLPFFYTHTNECVDICPIEFLFNEGCEIANFESGIEKMQSLIEIEYAKGNLQNFKKSISYSDGRTTSLFKIKIFPFIHTTNENDTIELSNYNENQKINNDNDLEETEIYLDECIELLKNYSIINDETELTMLKFDIKNDDGINNYDFELFDDNNRLEKVDLSLCYNKTIKITFKKNIEKLLKELSNSTNIDFFNDICNVFTSENGTDVLIEDRKIDYFYKFYPENKTNYNINNDTICPPNSELLKIDYNSKYGFCSCFIEDMEDIIKNSSTKTIRIRNLISKSYSNTNIKVLKCIKNISKYFSKSYVLIIITFLFAGYITTGVMYFALYRNNYKSSEEFAPTIITKSQKLYKLGNSINVVSPPKSRMKADKIIKFMDSKSEVHSIKNNKSDIYRKSMKKLEKLATINFPYTPKIKIDLDLVDYAIAIVDDKRTFIRTFLSILQKREIYIYAFKKDHNIRVLKIGLVILCFINFYMVNLFFFSEKVIHKIYEDKGKYNFGYQIKFILLSALISCIFLYIAKYIFLFKESIKQYSQIIKCIDCSFIIIVLLLVFYWIYIGSFTTVYINTQKHLSINFILTFVFYSIYELILTLISCILRKISLSKKNLQKLYEISVCLVSLKKIEDFFQMNLGVKDK